jgi:hypothetical protein
VTQASPIPRLSVRPPAHPGWRRCSSLIHARYA